MESISIWVTILFILTTIVAVGLFFKATQFSKKVMIITLAWMMIHAVLSLSGFYFDFTSVPPRFALLVVPALILIAVVFATASGRAFIDRIDIKTLTLLHAIRIPVEIVLLQLFISGMIPRSMTFEGTNFDIISGITAPVIYYLVFISKKAGPAFLFAWNILCLLLLLNVVITAVLSVPTPFQKFAFDQPNVGVVYFPFMWLPCAIVPIVLFSHVVGLRHALKYMRKSKPVLAAA